MSNRQFHSHQEHHGLHGRPHAHPVKRLGRASDWTLGHGSRQVRVGPVAFWVIVGSLVLMAGWLGLGGVSVADRGDLAPALASVV